MTMTKRYYNVDRAMLVTGANLRKFILKKQKIVEIRIGIRGMELALVPGM